MKTFSHSPLVITIGLILVAVFVIGLPALGLATLPLGAMFFLFAFLSLVFALAATVWLYLLQSQNIRAAEKQGAVMLKKIPLIFFTLNTKMQLGRFFSAEFEAFFYGKNFGVGTDFSNILGFLADAEIRHKGCDYVQLLLAHTNSTSTATDANPLACVSALMLNSEGRPEHRHFRFHFSDFLDNGRFAGVLVAIYDISDHVNLATQIQALAQKSEQSTQTTLDLLIRMINLDRTTLTNKFASFERLLDEANLDLKDSGHSGVRHQTLADGVCKKIKLLKNEAKQLGLTELSAGAAEMAMELETLGQKAELSGNDFFSVALKLDELYDCLHSLGALLAQLPDPNKGSAVPSTARTAAEAPTPASLVEQAEPQTEPHIEIKAIDARIADAPAASPDTINTLSSLPLVAPMPEVASVLKASAARFEFALIQQACIRTAEKLGKKVAVRAQNLSSETVPDRLKQPLTEILVQLIRSSLAHGLELPDARTAAGKDETATLSLIWTELADGGYELIFRDDGCGLNFETIRARALALNRLTVEQAHTIEQRQLVGFIFEPGFATAIKAADNAGFGAGLDVVMATAKRAGGKISVGTQAGLYTQFRISFPAL
jgi:two-component system chemotaxis sensor kinase CheA